MLHARETFKDLFGTDAAFLGRESKLTLPLAFPREGTRVLYSLEDHVHFREVIFEIANVLRLNPGIKAIHFLDELGADPAQKAEATRAIDDLLRNAPLLTAYELVQQGAGLQPMSARIADIRALFKLPVSHGFIDVETVEQSLVAAGIARDIFKKRVCLIRALNSRENRGGHFHTSLQLVQHLGKLALQHAEGYSEFFIQGRNDIMKEQVEAVRSGLPPTTLLVVATGAAHVGLCFEAEIAGETAVVFNLLADRFYEILPRGVRGSAAGLAIESRAGIYKTLGISCPANAELQYLFDHMGQATLLLFAERAEFSRDDAYLYEPSSAHFLAHVVSNCLSNEEKERTIFEAADLVMTGEAPNYYNAFVQRYFEILERFVPSASVAMGSQRGIAPTTLILALRDYCCEQRAKD